MSQSPGDDRLRVGLVCVHGIGIQTEGATAQDVAQAIGLGVDELEGQIEFVEPDIDDRPAYRALIKIADVEPFELDIYEAWWDKLVDPPRFRTVLGWLIRIVPFLAIAIAVALADDLTTWRKQSEPNRSENDRMPIEFGLPMLVLIVFTPIVYMAFPLIALMGALPKRGAKLRNAFTAVLGDAWLYKSGKCDTTVMTHIGAVLEHASRNSDITVMLGHSQGAELARRVAARTEVDLGACIWVGSGKLPLGFLRAMSRRPLFGPLVTAFFVAFPALIYLFVEAALGMLAVTMLQLLMTFTSTMEVVVFGGPSTFRPTEALSDLMQALPNFIIPIVGLSVIPTAMFFFGRKQKYDEYYTDPDCQVVAIKSPLDPVSFGAVENDEVLRYVKPVRPLFTHWLAEHTAYFRKPVTGRIILEAILGTENVANDPYQPAVARWFKILSSVAMAAVVAIYLAIGSAEVDWISTL